MFIDIMFQSLQLLKTAIFDKECEACILTDANFVMNYSLYACPMKLSHHFLLNFSSKSLTLSSILP